MISSINNVVVNVVMQILVGKVMRKCHMDEVPVLVVSLAAQCAEGVQFKWLDYLCREFLENCCQAQEQGNTFHYAWLLLSIVLVAWELPEDNQFPMIAQDLSEAVNYASLWATKDVQRIRDNKIFWVFMEMNIRNGINHKVQLSTTVYNNLHSFMEFKVEFHHVYIRAHKDLAKTWHELPYLSMDDVIFAVLKSWPPKWHALASSVVEAEKSAAQRNKEEAKL